jgi:hypothetical protein
MRNGLAIVVGVLIAFALFALGVVLVEILP